jgi:hypothetical protein
MNCRLRKTKSKLYQERAVLTAAREKLPINKQIPRFAMSSDDEDDDALFDVNLIKNKPIAKPDDKFTIASDDDDDEDILEISISKFHEKVEFVWMQNGEIRWWKELKK